MRSARPEKPIASSWWKDKLAIVLGVRIARPLKKIRPPSYGLIYAETRRCCLRWRRLCPPYRKCPPIQHLLHADRFCHRAEIEVVFIKPAFLALRSVP
jgi:hypothetical protein